MDAPSFLLLILLTTVIALVTAVSFSFRIRKREVESSGLTEIAEMIRKGGMLFVTKKYVAIAILAITASPLLFYFLDKGSVPFMTASFLFGVLIASAADHVGMHSASAANVHVATALKTSPAKAFRLAFVFGAATGLTVVGLSLIGITLILYILYVIFGETWGSAVRILLGFGAGIASVALFARIGGSIFASAMRQRGEQPDQEDSSGSIVPECVGNDVGGIAGLGTDVLESHVLAIIAAVTLGWATIGTESAIFFPLMIAAFGILTSVIASAFVRTRKHIKVSKALRRGIFVNALLLLLTTFILARRFFPAAMAWEVSIACIAGIVAALLMRFLMGRAPSSRTVGTSVLLLILLIAIAQMSAGLYGIALATVGMLSILGIALAADASVPVLMNASMIVSAGDGGAAAKKNAQELAQGSNSLVAKGRGYACAASLLAALALMVAYGDAAMLPAIDLKTPAIFIGLLLGGVLPFLFSSMIAHAAQHAARTMAAAQRQQKNNANRSLSLTATTALLETAAPAILAIGAPILVGFVLGSPALAGLLFGSMIAGLPLSISMLSKPSCDPAIASLLKLMAVVSLLTAPLIAG